MDDAALTLERFLDDWTDTPEETRKAFIRLKDRLSSWADVTLEFIPRPGITYSLRAVHGKQRNRPLFAMVDVIEDAVRWLSVCFFGEMINDPEDQGDIVPEGLLGEDAVCFDLESYDEEALQYLEARLDEALENAARNG